MHSVRSPREMSQLAAATEQADLICAPWIGHVSPVCSQGCAHMCPTLVGAQSLSQGQKRLRDGTDKRCTTQEVQSPSRRGVN